MGLGACLCIRQLCAQQKKMSTTTETNTNATENVEEQNNKRKIEEALTSEERKDVEPAAKKQKLAKRKVALYFGYNGAGYCGLQLNSKVKSVESDLFGAIIKAGGVSQDNSKNLAKNKWLRASRTDKGVHAAMNVVSLKIGAHIFVKYLPVKVHDY